MKLNLVPNLIKNPIVLATISGAVIVLVSIIIWNEINPNQSVGSLGTVLGNKSVGVLTIEAPQKIKIDDSLKVQVMMNSGKSNVNAVGVNLHFDHQRLQVIHLDTNKSFCQFYPEKKFDNRQGLITLACGSPHPGFSGISEILSIEFKPLVTGSTQILTANTSKILKSDGKGTNILEQYPNKTINILTNH